MLPGLGLAAALSLAALSPEESVRRYLLDHSSRFGLEPAEVGAMAVVRSYPTPGLGITTVWLQQTSSGLRVDGAIVRFAVDAGGEVRWSHADALHPGLAPVEPASLVPDAAVRAAALATGIDLGGAVLPACGLGPDGDLYLAANLASPARVEALALPSGVAGYRVTLESAKPHDLWAVTVEGRAGAIVRRDHLRWNVQDGQVFNGQHPDTQPGGVPQSLESFGPTPESPLGWLLLTATTSQGNNCDVKEDWPPDNETTVGARADGGANQEFRFPFLDSWQASGDYPGDLNAAITNVFYWTNRWHDLTYALGFNEAAGNCQAVNSGLGGAENDAVYVDVQNGAAAMPTAVNNLSNVTTPVDGTRPRITLYLWDGTQGPKVDAAFDADVVLHELTHILVNRLVGGPATSCMAGTEPTAVTEGIADFFPLDHFGSTAFAEYISGDQTRGIRDAAIDANPRTYCDFAPALNAYQRGGILASALWNVRAAIGGPATRQLLVDALKLVPCNPGFVAVRDGLVQADLLRNAGANRCAIWSAFRARGVGYDARPGGGAGCDLTYNLPACSGEAFLRTGAATFSDAASGNNDGLIAFGETIEVSLALSNLDGAAGATGVTATLTPRSPGITMIDATQGYPDIAAGGSAVNPVPFRFRADSGYVCGSAIQFDVSFTWSAPLRTRAGSFLLTGISQPGIGIFADDAEGAAPVWTPAVTAAFSAAENHTPGGARSYWMSSGCWTANEPTCPPTRGACDNTCATLTSPQLILPAEEQSELRFWARYNLQDSVDGLLVQVSADGGQSWTGVPVAGGAAINNSNSGCQPQGGQVGVTGPAGNAGLSPWTEFSTDLSAWIGREVTVRIVQHLSGCIYHEGAYIDDLALSVRHCIAAPFAKLHAVSRALTDDVTPCSDQDGEPDPGETVRVDTTLVNLGSATATAANAVLESPNIHLLGLPSAVAIGDLAPGQTAPASFTFGVAPLPGATCGEDAELTLRYTSTVPSSNTETVPALLNTDPLVTWLDNFEGVLPAWTASLGPDGTDQDWALHELDCFTGTGNRYFWGTQQGIVQTMCSTGEPDYRADSDSVLTSADIDLGGAGATLLELSWSGFQGGSVAVQDGFTQVLLDHDNDGTFTPLWTSTGGFGGPDATGLFRINLTAPPDGTPLPAASTTQQVKVQARFRSTSADPGATTPSSGWILNNVRLTYRPCPLLDCTSCDPPPAFAGAREVVDLDPCQLTGVEVRWDAAPFGPRGGTYTVYRDGVPVTTGLSASPFVDTPGDGANHRYRVRAVTAQCRVDDGNLTQITSRDDAATAAPNPIGNTLTAVKSALDLVLAWLDDPAVQSYSAARSDTADFQAPLTIVGTPATGTPTATDMGVVGSGPGLQTYRVATALCGLTSSY